MKYSADQCVWAALRWVMGFMFVWAFADKLFGLGFATTVGKAWLHGGSPTTGFLSHSSGWFASIFQSLAGSPVVDVLFMAGLLLIGLSLLLGVGMKIAGWSGAVLVFLMWMANFPPTQNPVIDSHTIYLIVLIGLATTNTKPGRMFGLGQAWSGTSIVKRNPWLE
jgi:thiosulfate dehydrogenase [quinone] large subunit